MNSIDDVQTADDDQRFDLLVDGELSDRERRRLLDGLDDEPGGWRQCALAFLEAQAWQRDFGAIVEPPRRTDESTAPPSPRPWLGRRGKTLLAMAASFLVALLLGTQLQGLIRSPGPGGTSTVADGELPEQPQGPPAPPESTSPEGPGEGPLQPADVVSGPWRVVGNGDAFDLPTVSRDEIDEEWLSSFPVPIPEETIRQWERDGCGVVRRREYVPYRMPDGRQLVVPMDKYEIRYVGRPAL